MPFANSLSFKPETENQQEPSLTRKVVFWITASGKKIVIITELIVIICLLAQTYFVRQLNEINQSIADTKKFIIESADIENKFRMYTNDISFLKKAHSERILWSEVTSNTLKEMTTQKGIYMESIEFKSGEMSISGVTNTSQDFAFLIQALLSQSDENKLIVNASSYQPKDKTYSFGLMLVKK